MKYTQREWDRVVGYGKVPEQYRLVSDRKTDGQDSTRGNKTREEVRRTAREVQDNARRYGWQDCGKKTHQIPLYPMIPHKH